MEPKIIEQLHQRVVELAQERGVSQGRKMRVDTNIHDPSDSRTRAGGKRNDILSGSEGRQEPYYAKRWLKNVFMVA